MNPAPHDEDAFLADLSPRLFPKGKDGTTRKLKLPTNPPEGYFEALPERVMARVAGSASQPTTPRKVPLINVRNLAIAAAVAVIIALIPILRHALDSEQTLYPDESAWTAADEAMWLDYLDEEDLLWEDADPEQYAEVYLPDDLTAEDLENYLLDENITDVWIIEEMNWN